VTGVLIAAMLSGVPARDARPDPPVPRVSGAEIVAVHPPVRRGEPFWTRTTKIEAGAVITVAVFDAAQSCHNLAVGGQERWLHTRSCGGVVGRMAAWDAGMVGAAWLLHRTHHNKLARLPMLFEIEEHTRGIVYSKEHGAW
jgi:hypothetical protein